MYPVSSSSHSSPQPHSSKNEEPKRQSLEELSKEQSEPSTSFAHKAAHETSKHKESRKRTKETTSRHESSAKRHRSSQYSSSGYRRYQIEQQSKKSSTSGKEELAIKHKINNAIHDDDPTILSRLLSDKSVDLTTCIGSRNLLTLSAKEGALKCTKFLLTNKFDINTPDSCGNTALITACYFGQPVIVRALLAYGADVKFCNKNDNTALNAATHFGHLTCIKELYSKIKSPLSSDSGMTGLMSAVMKNKPECIPLLIQYEDINSVNSYQQTALHLAVKFGSLNILPKLLKYKPNLDLLDKYGITPLHLALNRKVHAYRCSKLLIEAGADINKQDERGNSILAKQIMVGKTPAVEFLLENGANTEVKNNFDITAILLASGFHDERMVQTLIKYNADLTVSDKKNYTALHRLYDTYSVKRQPDLTLAKQEPFDVAKITRMTKLLLSANPALVNKQDLYGKTPSMVIAQHGWTPVLEELLKYKPDLELRDAHGKTAFMIAIKHQNLDCAKLLYRSELINSTDNWGTTALMFAAMKGDSLSIKYLLKKHISPDYCENVRGMTALTFAIKSESKECIQLLLAAIPNSQTRAREIETAMNYVHEQQVFDTKLIKLLQKHRLG